MYMEGVTIIVDDEMQGFDLVLSSTRGLPTLNLDGQRSNPCLLCLSIHTLLPKFSSTPVTRVL
jgi:hypothetical protein